MNEKQCSSTEGATDAPVSIEDLCSTPPTDVYETPKEVVILVDMPGVKSEDVDLDLDGNTLTIAGKVAPAHHEGRNLLTEYCNHNYFRSFYVGDNVDRTKIAAEINDGVLKIVLPKAKHATSRRIPIS